MYIHDYIHTCNTSMSTYSDVLSVLCSVLHCVWQILTPHPRPHRSLQHMIYQCQYINVNIFNCVAVCWQCVAVCCKVVQGGAVCWQCVAVYCSVVQCV